MILGIILLVIFGAFIISILWIGFTKGWTWMPGDTEGSNYNTSRIHSDRSETFLKLLSHLRDSGYEDKIRTVHKAWIRMDKGEPAQTMLEMHIEAYLKANNSSFTQAHNDYVSYL